MEKVKYSNFGWLPAKEMKPYNNHTVVMMVEQNGDLTLIEKIGYYENGEWVIYDVDNDYENIVHYWYPIPSLD